MTQTLMTALLLDRAAARASAAVERAERAASSGATDAEASLAAANRAMDVWQAAIVRQPMAPWVARALAGTLPGKDYTR